MKSVIILLITILIAGCRTAGTNAVYDKYWSDNKIEFTKRGIPEKYRALKLDLESLKASVSLSNEVTIPLPNGTYINVQLNNSGVMSTELAKKFPEIKSYEIVSDSGISGRVDINPSGFYAMVIQEGGTYFINPVEKKSDQYIAYNKKYIGPNLNNPFIDKFIKNGSN